MNGESKLLIAALRSAMTGETPKVPEQVDWQNFLTLAAVHKIEGLVYSGLKNVELPNEVSAQLQSAYRRAVFSDTQFSYVSQQLAKQLTDAQVPHIFMKGACLKQDYPIPALRTMADLDVLVHTQDYEKVDAVCAALGARSIGGDGNHRSFVFPGGVPVEFHPNMLHHATLVAPELNPGWQYAKKDASTYAMELTEEGFYLHVLCHMADHFVGSGIGVRFVLDVWVLRNRRKQPLDWDFVEQELNRFGLLEFAENIERLAQVWFGTEETDPVMDELAEYILTSGVHGRSDRAMLNAMAMSKGGNRFSALCRKAFYPRAELEDRYPWAKGKPWLLPAAWCARAFRAVTTHGQYVAAWSKGTANITDDQVQQQRQQLERFGIHRK